MRDAATASAPILSPPAFFLAERGTRITQWALRWTFAKLSKQLGLRAPSKSHGVGPRLHDSKRCELPTLTSA